MNIEQGISNDEVNRDCQNKRKFDLEEIIKRCSLTNEVEKIEMGLIECNELIAIFNKSIETAKKNDEKRKQNADFKF